MKRAATAGRPPESRPKDNPLRRWWVATGKHTPVEDLAKLFGCSVPTVYGLLVGNRVPSLGLASIIEEKTGGLVRASSWTRRASKRGRT